MSARFTDEQLVLAETVRDLASSGLAHARDALEGRDPAPGPTAALFEGFGGLAVPDDRGGFGGGLVDLAIVVCELARTISPTPFVSHVLATQVALAADLDVADAVTGTQRWALAVDEPAASPWGPWGLRLGVDEIAGRKVGVVGGSECDAAVVVGEGGVVGVAVPSARHPRSCMDRTRPVADLEFSGTPAVVGTAAAELGLARAGAIVAAELAGTGRGVIDLAAAYVHQREQFGQPVGKFQSVAHPLAEAHTAAQHAWSLALYAAWAVDAGAADARRAVSSALAKSGSAAIMASEVSTQSLGGLGIAWEADAHLFLRRAMASATWLGAPSLHRQALARAVLAEHAERRSRDLGPPPT